MPNTPRLHFPLIASGQTQKDVTHNEAILAIERVTSVTVTSRSVITPPTAPPEGAVFIVPAVATQTWGQPAGMMMHWHVDGWQLMLPHDGQVVLLADEGVMLVHRQGWQSLWPVLGLEVGGRAVLAAPPSAIAPPSGGGTVDSQARDAIASIISLLVQQGLARP